MTAGQSGLTNDAASKDETAEIGRSRDTPVSANAGESTPHANGRQDKNEPRTDEQSPDEKFDSSQVPPRIDTATDTATENDQRGNVVEFPSKRTSNVGRKRQGERLSVNCVKASRNTWAIRIRHLDEEWPPVVVKRVSDEIFKQLTRNKKRYVQFKQNQIDQWKLGTVRPDIARGSTSD
jgi:hypothetical protein